MLNENVNFKILCYTTDNNNINFINLQKTLNIINLPKYNIWTSDFYYKSLAVLNYLNQYDNDDIIMVCDAHDVFGINNINNELLCTSIMNNFNIDSITFNAEKNCYPDNNLKNIYPNLNSKWNYLNAGLYVGKSANIKNMLISALPEIKNSMDQRIFTKYYLNNVFNIKLDFKCKVFQTLYMLDDNDLSINNNIITNNNFNTQPLLLHGNGNSIYNLKKVYVKKSNEK